MKITAIGRLHFQVSSRGRRGVVHLVDLEPQEGRRYFCSCERFTMHPAHHGTPCHHVEAVVKHIQSLKPKPMNPDDLKIESIAPPSKGGQQCGRPSSRIQVTHLPTGLVASCDFERSSSRNRKVCLAMIEYGLAELRA